VVEAGFLGGPFDGMQIALEHPIRTINMAGLKPNSHLWDPPNPEEPVTSQMEQHQYAALTDPETGEYLGGYIYVGTAPNQ